LKREAKLDFGVQASGSKMLICNACLRGRPNEWSRLQLCKHGFAPPPQADENKTLWRATRFVGDFGVQRLDLTPSAVANVRIRGSPLLRHYCPYANEERRKEKGERRES